MIPVWPFRTFSLDSKSNQHVHVFDISVSIEWIRNGRQLVSIVLSVGCHSKIDKNNWIDLIEAQMEL